MYICTCMLRGGEASPRGEGEVKPPPRGGEAPPPGGGRRSLPPVGGTPPRGGMHPRRKMVKNAPPPNLFHTPPKKTFLPPQKNQKNSYLIKKQNRGNGVWGRFFKSKFASDASFLRYLQKTKNLIFLHIRFRETL